jgi:hypothetical protein
MYNQPSLDTWCIMYQEHDTKTAKAFIETFKKCLDSIKYFSNRPKEFVLKSSNFKEWEGCIRNNFNPNVQCVILLLPG